jgi:hypothetical protein
VPDQMNHGMLSSCSPHPGEIAFVIVTVLGGQF